MIFTSELSDLVAMQSNTKANMLHSKFGFYCKASGRNLNEYDPNNLEQIKKEPIHIEFTEQKADSDNDENALTLDG